MNHIIIQPCDPTSPCGFKCPQHRVQAEKLPDSVGSGNAACVEALVALGLCTLELAADRQQICCGSSMSQSGPSVMAVSGIAPPGKASLEVPGAAQMETRLPSIPFAALLLLQELLTLPAHPALILPSPTQLWHGPHTQQQSSGLSARATTSMLRDHHQLLSQYKPGPGLQILQQPSLSQSCLLKLKSRGHPLPHTRPLSSKLLKSPWSSLL